MLRGILSKLMSDLVQNLPTLSIVRQYSKGKKGGNGKAQKPEKRYNTPHPPRDPPDKYNPSDLNHSAFEAPEFMPVAIFRPFYEPNETLGPGASKCECYKNAEYFAYHRFSFTSLQQESMEVRAKRLAGIPTTCFYEKEDITAQLYAAVDSPSSSSSSSDSSSSSSSGSSSDESSEDECEKKCK